MAEEFQTQIVREAPEIEAYKLGLLQQAQSLYGTPMSLPAVEAAGLAPGQEQAAALARSGIGAYQPFLEAGSQGITAGQGLTQQGAQLAGGINVSPAFAQAQSAQQAGLQAAGGVGQAANIAGGFLQANLAPSQQALGQAAGLTGQMVTQGTPAQQQALSSIGQGQQAFGQMAGGVGSQIAGQNIIGQGLGLIDPMLATGVGAQQQGMGAVQQGIAGLQQATQAYDPNQAAAFMNPYQQMVTQNAVEEMRRQGQIAAQQTAAQAVRSGAFGGTREGVQRAEQERNLQDLMSQRVFQDYAANFGQAQNAAMTAAEQQQQRQMAAAQGTAAAGSALGGLGAQAANIFGQAGQQLTQAGTATGALGAQAANIYGQMGQGLTQSGQAQSGIGATLANIYGQAGQQMSNLGNIYGQQGLSQAQLGQAGASTMGGLAGQQAQLYGGLGQGIGALGAQQAGVDLSRAQSLGQFGTNLGALGVQQAALGQAQSQLRGADVNMLAGVGALEQAAAQAQLDASRATRLQETMAPYQQLGFISDIYKGAPTSQMALTSSTAPTASPFQSALGTVVGGVTTAAAASRAGLF
jgi:hypothetical protein